MLGSFHYVVHQNKKKPMASISKQSKEVQDRHRKLLAEQLKKPENGECMDCRSRNPTWASTNLGIYVCIRCSGLHRQIGVHITKVKSCTMDLWDPEQIAFMQSMGNARAKEIYEAKLPPDYGKPAESEDSALVLQWIRTKYEKKKYWTTGSVDLKAVPRSSLEKPAAASQQPQQGTGKKGKQQADGQQQGQAQPQPTGAPLYAYDEFMSPSALSPNVQSPRGTPIADFPQQQPHVVTGFDDSQPMSSAFSFLNATAGGNDAPLSQQTFLADPPQAESGSGAAAFSFVDEPSLLLPHGSPKQQDASAASQFAFINGDSSALLPSAGGWVDVGQLPLAPPARKELPPDSLLVLECPIDGPKSSIGVTIRNPPLIPGHFATPDSVIPPAASSVVFDPFEDIEHQNDRVTHRAQIVLPVEPFMSPPQLPVPFSSPTSGPRAAPSPLPLGDAGATSSATMPDPMLVQQQLLAMQQQLQQQFLALQMQLQQSQQ